MSINPVQPIENVNEAQLAQSDLRSQSPRSPVHETSAPDPGTRPTQEVRTSPNVSASPDVQQDEVEVQRDNEVNDEIVIRYVDHSGNLILQVPSSQVLGLTRAIGEDFQQQAKARAATSAERGGEGDRTHGH